MKIGVKNLTEFKDNLAVINSMIMEITFRLNSEGLEAGSMDTANVSQLILTMKRSEFSEWDVAEDTAFTIKVSDLKTILSRGDKDSQLILSIGDKLNVILLGKNGKKKEYDVGLIGEENKRTQLPASLKYTATVNMDMTLLKEGMADIEVVSESIQFIVENNKLFMKGSGDINGGNIDLLIPATTKEVNAVVKSKYSLEYLNKFAMTKLSKTAKMQFATDHPVLFTFSNGTGTEMTLLLAPRIEN